jgi:ribonuclease HII
MPYLIGTDEAGYGPNLGPLVISATVWRVAEPPQAVDLYRSLDSTVSRDPNDTRGRLAIADSKQLYQSRGSLASLERGVLAAAALLDIRPDDSDELCDRLDPECRTQRDGAPWHAAAPVRLPCESSRDEIETASERLSRGLRSAWVMICDIVSAMVFPARFNRLIERFGNKSTLLSAATMQLIARALAGLPDEPILIVCDKHGGRNRYGQILQTQFPEPLIEVREESRAQSVYRWRRGRIPVEIRFITGGESFLPAALASMTSKYLRELSMATLNTFWQQRVPNLRSTAGYPVDARRFFRDIASLRAKMGIDDSSLWRCR